MKKQVVIQGNNLDLLPLLPEASIDAIVTDPPYGLAFMGKSWDKTLPDPRTWSEALRVLKPGGHAAIFGAPRLYHRLAVQVEDAGFEVRDVLMWMFSTGFPKSLNFGCRCPRSALPYVHDTTEPQAQHHVPDLRSRDVPPPERDLSRSGAILLPPLPQQSAPSQGAPSDIPTHGGFGESGLEGRGDLPSAEGQLPEREVRSLSGDVPTHGSGGRLRDGAPADRGASPGTVPLASGDGAPQESRSHGQSNRESGAVLVEQGSQAVRGARTAVTDLGRCECCGGVVGREGFGTSLKPAYEPILLVRKPLAGTVAQNVIAHGTGGINVDACRVGDGGGTRKTDFTSGAPGTALAGSADGSLNGPRGEPVDGLGRWPANVIMDEEAGAILDEQTGELGNNYRTGRRKPRDIRYHEGAAGSPPTVGYSDSGGASRFFYCPKASRSEREAGLEAFPARVVDESREDGSAGRENPRAGAGRKGGGRRNHHPTVKPLDLMAWLVRLITPPGGIVLDPFTGSGSTLVACAREDVRGIGFELDPEYVAIGNARIAHWSKKG